MPLGFWIYKVSEDFTIIAPRRAIIAYEAYQGKTMAEIKAKENLAK